MSSWLAIALLLAGCDRVFGVDAPDAGVELDAPPDADTSGCLRDNFQDNRIDDVKWAISDADNTPIAILERDHQLVVSLAPGPDSSKYTGNTLRSLATYDMTGGSATVEVVRPVLGGGAESYLVLYDYSTGVNQYTLNTGGGGSIGFGMTVDGVRNIVARQWTADDHFWRIRHDAVTNEVHLEVSAAGEIWNTGAIYPAQVPVTNLHVGIGGGTFQIRNPDPGAGIYDDFQLVTATCPALPTEAR